jgi:hypothetical protein
MTPPENPYNPPMSAIDGPAGVSSPFEVPRSVIDLLAQTRPWVKLLAVMFIISLGLMVLFGLAAAAGALKAVPGGGGALALFPIAIVIAIYVPPVLYMWRYVKGIRRLQDGGGIGALEEALGSQKSFWKYIGVLTLILICIYALFIVIALATGVLGTLMMKG